MCPEEGARDVSGGVVLEGGKVKAMVCQAWRSAATANTNTIYTFVILLANLGVRVGQGKGNSPLLGQPVGSGHLHLYASRKACKPQPC